MSLKILRHSHDYAESAYIFYKHNCMYKAMKQKLQVVIFSHLLKANESGYKVCGVCPQFSTL